MLSKRPHLSDFDTVKLMKGFLERLNPDENPYLVIHSDVLALKDFTNPVENSIRAFQEYSTENGTTLFFPTFTPAVCSSAYFSNMETTCDTGLINNHIRVLKDAIRSNHPMDSYAAIGKDKEKVQTFFGESLHGKGSACDFFHLVNARFILWGARPSKITMIHYYEFAIHPVYRYYKNFKGMLINATGERTHYKVNSLVKKRFLTQSYDFDHLDDALLNGASYLAEKYQDSVLYSVQEKDLGTFLTQRLAEKETYVLNDGDQVNEKAKQTRVSFLSSENLDLVKRIFDETLSEFDIQGISCEQLPFDTYKQDLLSALPLLYENGTNTAVFCERIETLLLKDYSVLINEKDLNSIVHGSLDEYLKYVQHFIDKTDGIAMVCDFTSFEDESFFYQNSKTSISNRVCQIANDYLESKLKEIPNVRIFKLSETIEHVGEKESFDRKLFLMAKIPFSLKLSKQVCFEVIGSILESQGRTIRGVILDLDNTLWGGVIGEDGIDQLVLGPEFPGRAYCYFQKTLKALSSRGILLALCSKNTESVAMHGIETHPYMILRKKDFSSIRINWEHKSENIRTIATELSLGFKNLAFIDDNPAERAEVKKMLPEILVPSFPDDVCDLSEIILNNPFFYHSSLSAEDLLRTQRFQTTHKIGQIKNSEEDLIAFYESLQMQAQLIPMNSRNSERVLSLIQKTNQFNTTSKRYTEKNITDIFAKGGEVYAIHYQDKLMPEGEDIGVVVTKKSEQSLVIDLFLMSCRYLNRTIETKVLSDLCQVAIKGGLKKMLGLFESSERNSIIHDLYSKHGFLKNNSAELEYSLDQALLAPKWFQQGDQR